MAETLETIAQAGALAWREGLRELEIVLVTARRGGWTIPKGHIEPGDSARRTAQMECYEEAGVLGVAWPTPLGAYTYVKPSGVGPCVVSVFALEVGQVLNDWPEASERERRWVVLGEAAGLVPSPDLARLIRRLPEHV